MIAVAENGSITEASKILFISQPSLSEAVHQVENETGVTVFTRSRAGVALTKEGMEFLGYARQVVQQMELLEAKYINNEPPRQRFCISTQHYTFTTNAFVELIQKFGEERFEFILNETQTHQILEDVRNRFSDIGILYMSRENESVLTKLLEEYDLQFSELLCVSPHVFLSKDHPLAHSPSLKLEDLRPYPRLSFVQGNYESAYFSEELFSTVPVEKSIKVSDRAAVVNLMIGVNEYTISSGIFPKYLQGDDIISIILEEQETMRIESLCCVPMSAIGNALSSYTAQNIGANKKERVSQGYKTANLLIILIALLLCIILEGFHKPIIAMFLDEAPAAQTVETGEAYLKFIGFFFCMIGFKMAADGILRGAGDVKVFTIANLVNLTIRVALSWFGAPIWGVAIVWIAVPLGWTANFCISFAHYKTGKWKSKNIA